MVTPTNLLQLKIQDTSDQNWGPPVEENLQRLEEAIASEVAISTTGGTTTLTTSNYIANQARRPILRVSGTLASNAVIQVPAPGSAKLYLLLNQTTGSYTVTLRIGASGETVEVLQGYACLIMVNATDAWAVSPQVNLTTGRSYIASNSYGAADPVSLTTLQSRVVTLLDRSLDTPPGAPAAGDTYHTGGSPTGAWSGQADKIARYDGAAWLFEDVPTEGMMAWVVDEGKLYITDGGTLTDVLGAGGIADGAVVEAKLGSGSVTESKLGSGAVTEDKIGSGAVALAKLKADVYASENESKTGSSTTKIPAVANIKHAAFPAGTAMLFRQTTAPTGWTKVTDSVNDRAVRVVSGTPADGGSVDFSTAFASRSIGGSTGNTTLTTDQIPDHTHVMFTPPGDDQFASSPAATSSQYVRGAAWPGSHPARYYMIATDEVASVGKSGNTGGGQSHNHSLSVDPLDLRVRYIDMIIATKDAAS